MQHTLDGRPQEGLQIGSASKPIEDPRLPDGGGPPEVGLTLLKRTRVLVVSGDLEGADAASLEALRIFSETRDVSALAQILDLMAVLAAAERMPERAVRLAGAASGARQTVDTGSILEEEGAEDPRNTARRFLSEETIAKVWADGRALSLEEALGYAREGARSSLPREAGCWTDGL
jgi:hypothetical protein